MLRHIHLLKVDKSGKTLVLHQLSNLFWRETVEHNVPLNKISAHVHIGCH